jgi:hypothetical protein
MLMTDPDTHPVTKPDPEAEAERRRAGLRRELDRNDLTPADAARLAGFPTANALYNFLNGRTRSLSHETLEALAKVIPGATVGTLSGIEAARHQTPWVRSVIVQVEARANEWRQSGSLPLSEQFEAPMPIEPEEIAGGAFGAIVRPPGAEMFYPDGTLLVCMPLPNDVELGDGSVVLLERMRNADRRVEITVRQIRVLDDKGWLWMPSTDPRVSPSVEMPWPYLGRPWTAADERYRLTANVIGRFIRGAT